MTFTSKSTSYSVSTESQSFKLVGNVSAKESALIRDFNGTIQNLDGTYLANFSYRENEAGTCDKSISNASKEQFADIDNFLDAAIVELKSELPE